MVEVFVLKLSDKKSYLVRNFFDLLNNSVHMEEVFPFILSVSVNRVTREFYY